MVILAIVAGVLAPSLRGFGINRQTDNAARLIVTLADYARTQAISEGRPYRLNVDPAARAFWLSVQDDGAFVSPNNDYGRRFELSRGLEIQSDLAQQPDGQYIEFRPTGRIDPARLTVTNQEGGQIDIASLSATEPLRILKPGEVGQ
jgi:Tfp pilus assembly protein FimT